MSVFYKLLIHTSDGHRFSRTMRSRIDQQSVVDAWIALANSHKVGNLIFIVDHASGKWNFRLGDIVFMEVSMMTDEEVLEETKLNVTIKAKVD